MLPSRLNRPLFVLAALAAIAAAGCSLNPQPIPPGPEEDDRQDEKNGGASPSIVDPGADGCEADAGSDAGTCQPANDSSDAGDERVHRRPRDAGGGG